ncbi:glycosyl transferase [Amycolatopsis balhimycina DSM 5908]|uniref:Glycosyl transferase n=1 Tax=Amycolatopsis balhimycina DSM 5908 TaxID=1081091 RepID=A0A428VY43_AMYBA|nr:macrolide family glycosyltransferase [Amycolatopsis balhimycina]RSM35689.1 glycosyl transferase [Amycolatopsis balhimycina DSM 5908]
MHVLFVTVPAQGHLRPTLPLARELRDRGHRVTYAAHDKFRADVEAAGAALLPIPVALPPRSATPSARHTVATAEALLAMTKVSGRLLNELFENDRPDVLCYDSQAASATMVAERFHVPCVALNPTYASNSHFSLDELLAGGTDMSDPRAVEIFTEIFQRQLRTAAEFGLTPPHQRENCAPLNLVFLPRSFQPAADTFDERFQFVGPALGGWADDTAWRKTGDRPLLFISMGSFLADTTAFFRQCFEAFGGTGWQVAVAIGEHVDPAALGPAPANTEVRPYFPQLSVLRHAEAFVSHAGMNSVLESLTAGVPLVTVPQQREELLTARTVADQGLGLLLEPETLTAQRLRDAVDTVHTSERIQANVAAVREELRLGVPAATRSADLIEHHLATLTQPA